jgi:hypothetical protein
MPGMSEERKRPIWHWIIPISIGLLVLYVLSYGPFMTFHTLISMWPESSLVGFTANMLYWIHALLSWIYAPLSWISNSSSCPSWIQAPYNAYIQLWVWLGLGR